MPKDAAYQLAEQKIADALRSGATELDLRSMQLTELPESIGQFTQLTSLNLSNNQLTTLPDSLPLAQLTQLTSLNLSNNQLTSLPDSLGQLTQLKSLDIAENQLTTLPYWLSKLSLLERLSIDDNKITEMPQFVGDMQNLSWLRIGSGAGGNLFPEFPPTIKKMKHLTTLFALNCNFSAIPDWLGELKELRTIYLSDNHLADLPSSLAQLEHLTSLNLDNNPLNPALQSAYDACELGKYEPLFAYLRSLENAEPLYEAKLVLVGEGNVGKTTLLKALKNQKGAGAPKKDERTTHGVEIDIHGLRLPHPQKDGVEIQLNAWDFGGQDVYRVTHQFFFSRRSLYLLVWEPRNNVQQGRLDEWLEMIRLRVGDEARVIIVSTHCREGGHLARIDKPVFKAQYGDMIVDFCEVDSLVPDESTGEMTGIAALKQVIARASAALPQMGMGFNRDWKAARDELINHPEPRISYSTFSGICAARGLSQLDADTLARLMHDLGYIVHYADDEKLHDDVVLKPEWLTKAIGFVLEDRATRDAEGILPDGHLTQVWRDHPFKDEPRYDPALYPFFLRLMEKYDVSYRLPDDRRASLVAQHVPQVRPPLPWLPEDAPQPNLRRIAMICAMEEDPPGLVPWMIVRTHDYAVEQNHHRLHWQKGMFLSHGTHGQAMLEKRGREFHVYTQGQWPEYFMNILQNTLEKLITDNWPGLKDRYRFAVPCPEVVKGEPCKGRFNIHALRQFLAEGDTHVRCQECSCRLSIAELLLGFEERDMSVQLREIKEQIVGMDSRIANYFMALMHAIADEAKSGPRLFTFRERDAGFSLKQLVARPLAIQLWCEAEGCQHPIFETGMGLYRVDMPHKLFVQIVPYANFVLKVLATVAPIAAPAINVCFGRDTTKTWDIDRQLDLAKAIVGKLPAKIETSDRGMTPGKVLSEPERSGILLLHRFLNEVDPTQAKLGLHRVPTYTGDFRWLCDYHYAQWQPNIPDVIQ